MAVGDAVWWWWRGGAHICPMTWPTLMTMDFRFALLLIPPRLLPLTSTATSILISTTVVIGTVIVAGFRSSTRTQTSSNPSSYCPRIGIRVRARIRIRINIKIHNHI